MSLRSQGGITGQGGQQLRPQFNQTQQPSQDSAFTSYPKSTSNNTLSSTQSSQPSRQDMGQQRVATPNSQPGPPQQQAPVSGPSSSSYAKPPPISLEQSRQIAKTHFDALRDWLRRENGLANGSTRNNAREKLTRLTRQQFQELSTDVYDELVRRMEEGAGRPGDQPYLSIRGEFHPKRNQARQKLATLPLQRFRDLASDVFFELERRYPEFAEDENVRGSSPSSNINTTRHQANDSNGSIGRRALANVPGAASNDIVVPNKSTLVMEEPRERENSDFDPPSRDAGGRASEISSVGTRFMANYAGSAPNSETGGHRSWDHEEKEKMKSEYEYKITMMQKRIAELEKENDDSREALMTKSSEAARARDLESQIRDHRDRYADQSSTLQRLRTDHEALQTSSRSLTQSSADSSRLRSDLDRITNERAEAEELANELRDEVGSLVDELRSVNARYEEVMEDRDRDAREIREIEEESRGWRKKYEAAKVELRNVKATSQLFVGQIKVEGDHMPASADGLIADIHVASFQTSIDELLQAARAKEPSAVLPAMRGVVTAVEKIDTDVQSVDPRRISTLPSSEQDRLVSLNAKLNATLSNLLTASKNHAIGFGVSPVSLLDAAASHLSSTIVDLVRILKIRRTATGEFSNSVSVGSSPGNSNAGGRRPSDPSTRGVVVAVATPPLPPTKATNGYSAGLSGGSLNNARGIPSRTSEPELSQSASSSRSYASPPPISNLDREREREREDRYRPQQQQQQQGPPSGYGGSAQGRPSMDERGVERREEFGQRDRYDRAPSPVSRPQQQPSYTVDNGYQGRSQYAAQPEQSAGRGAVLTYGSPNVAGGAARDDSYEELKNYLEGQTEAIVHSIQSLLSAIRSGAQGTELNENLTQIITIVTSIVAITKDALPPHLRGAGESILRDLSDNCDRLSEMQESSRSAVFNKQTKQAMASASFGVAKSLKALNALLGAGREEDSLT